MATRTYIRVGVAVGALLTIAMMLPMIGTSRGYDRELRLIAVGLTFYLEGETQRNPPIKLRPGEQVKITLRNEDDGMRHDFRIQAWNTGIPPIVGKGEQSIILRVPSVRGATSYACTPHAASMSGVIEVQ
jgi:hypothetical protein